MKINDEKKLFKESEKKIALILETDIFHDFANTLNGILGRSELLEMKTKHLKLVISKKDNIDAEIMGSCKKIIYDASMIAKEADRCFTQFNFLQKRFRA